MIPVVKLGVGCVDTSDLNAYSAGGIDMNPFTLEPNKKLLGYVLDRLASGADLQIDDRGAAPIDGGRQVRFFLGGTRTANGIPEPCRHVSSCDVTYPGGYNANNAIPCTPVLEQPRNVCFFDSESFQSMF